MSQFSLTHEVVKPRQSNADAKAPLLVMLHGVGANEQDLLPLAQYLDPRLCVVSARAPHRYQFGGFSWFDIHWHAKGFNIDTDQAQQSWETVQRFLGEACSAYDCDPQRIYLGGFSQGAIMSLGATLTKPELIAGTILMSGRWMPEVGPQTDRDHIANKPIVAVHGLYDEVIPIQYGRAIRDFLQTLPVQLEYHEFAMGHEINLDSLQVVVKWLKQQLG